MGRWAWKAGDLMIVPARGWNLVFQTVLNVAQFGLLGPFYRGQIVTELEIGARGSAGLTAQVGAVWTESDTASVESWATGSPIVSRSGVVGDGQPVFEFGLVLNSFPRMRFAIGRMVGQTPMYLVCRALGSHGASFINFYFAAFAVEVRADRV